MRVDDQAQFHPWKYLAALASIVDGDGSHVLELTRATDVRNGSQCEVETTSGIVRAAHVVVATQMPFLDRGLFFARAHPMKSYVIAAPIDTERAPRGMYISVDQPTRSIRSTPADNGGRMLIVGGEGHKPGDDPNTNARYAKLEAFMRERFGIDGAEYHWSTHDYIPVDKLPYIGRLRRGVDNIYVATGFAKWGLTKGTLAAEIISDAILGRPNEWADLYDSTRLDARHSAAQFAKENAGVGLRFFRDRLRPRDGREDVDRLAPGEGTIARVGAKQVRRLPRRRRRAARPFGALHPPRLHRRLEPRRPLVGVPVPRLALCRRRHARARTGYRGPPARVATRVAGARARARRRSRRS